MYDRMHIRNDNRKHMSYCSFSTTCEESDLKGNQS